MALLSSSPFLRRRKKRQPTTDVAAEQNDQPARGPRPVEIVAPDRMSAALLLEYSATVFPAEIVLGSAWVIRLHPPPTGGNWVLELLSLMERWLESTGLPAADVIYGGRTYPIRPPSPGGALGVAGQVA